MQPDEIAWLNPGGAQVTGDRYTMGPDALGYVEDRCSPPTLVVEINEP